MKNLATLFLLTGTFFTLVSFTSPSKALLGKWKGNDDGEVGLMIFHKGGYVSFDLNGHQMGGKKYELEGMLFDMYFESDETVTPHTIDFVIKLNESQEEVTRMIGIYKFVNPKTLIVNMDFEGTNRPTTFDPENPNQITFSKVK